jgi:hypothetical protein
MDILCVAFHEKNKENRRKKSFDQLISTANGITGIKKLSTTCTLWVSKDTVFYVDFKNIYLKYFPDNLVIFALFPLIRVKGRLHWNNFLMVSFSTLEVNVFEIYVILIIS